MMNHMKVSVLLVLMAFLCPSQSGAACVRTYTVGVLKDSPYYTKAPRVQATGLVPDLLTEIRKRLGCPFQEVPLNYVRALEEFKGQRLDLFAFTYINSDWLEFAEHKVVFSSERVLLVKKSAYRKKGALGDYLQDSKFKFGNLIGAVMFFQPREFEKLSKENRIVQSSTAEGVFQLLATGRVQGVFITPLFLRNLQAKPGFSNDFEAIDDPKTVLDIGIYISKRRFSKEESTQLKKVIDEMRADGTVRSILGKYVPAADLKRYN
ncbi:substrate-binding periplasmic protein [Bdellovibrio sp. HCB2-146]|uniref:substrate-binding periplasmic protein n=1 Tax=Bdellovibrio sp. HCB2-146 TaxID=3394362 RepID=UPI0039BC3CB9